MPSGSAERGFTYLALLLAVAVIGIGLAAVGQSWSTAAQRAKERELLFVGGEFRRAIRGYYLGSPGAQRYPRSLQELLEDKRFPFVRRHLRRMYRDPMTGGRDWGLVNAPEGGIMGVYSLSEAPALKTANFAEADRDLEGKARYSDWKFTFQPAPITASQAQRTSRTR
jgi:type II secretory pathway pseudopilin PulG